MAALLVARHPGLETELVVVRTTGDRRATTPVWEMGGQGVFVREVQEAVSGGRADAAVHSAKDLQPEERPGLCLAAFPERADARDAMVGATLAQLGPGATVATGSQRRRAQLAAVRPDLNFEGLRGNISTRLSRVPPGGAVVVAMAAIDRLGLAPAPLEVLTTDIMLPQVAQGALAVECRSDDDDVRELLIAADDRATRLAVSAERAFLSRLGGGCDLPVAGHARLSSGELVVEGLVATLDGSRMIRRTVRGEVGDGTARPGAQASSLGRHLAEVVMAEGGADLVAAARPGRT